LKDKKEVLHYNKLNFLYNDLMKKSAKPEEAQDEKKLHIVDEILSMTSGIMQQVFISDQNTDWFLDCYEA
jgi:hypothetical protein